MEISRTKQKKKGVNIRTSFGNNLRSLRESLNLSQRALADKIDVTQATIASYENSGKFPKRESIKNSLLRTLKCNEQELYGYSDGYYKQQLFIDKQNANIFSTTNIQIKELRKQKLISKKNENDNPNLNIFKKYPDGFFIEVNDNSMDRYIPNKSYAYVIKEKDLSAYNNKICALTLDGYKIQFRRLSFPQIDNLVTIIPQSTSNKFENKTINPDNYPNFKIFGYAVWFCKNTEIL